MIGSWRVLLLRFSLLVLDVLVGSELGSLLRAKVSSRAEIFEVWLAVRVLKPCVLRAAVLTCPAPSRVLAAATKR